LFGEACLHDGLLVESNPGAGVVHKHTDDIGHPDKFDCNAWCIGTGSPKGVCTVAAASFAVVAESISAPPTILV
jgi:hypothetical protein